MQWNILVIATSMQLQEKLAQSRSSIGVDFDFLEECDDELPLWELWEPCALCLELPPILLFSEVCVCFDECSFSLFLEVEEDDPLRCGGTSFDDERECLSFVFSFCCVSWLAISGEGLCIWISGVCRFDDDCCDKDIYSQKLIYRDAEDQDVEIVDANSRRPSISRVLVLG